MIRLFRNTKLAFIRKALLENSGSVMLEFILVLPIYLLLLGGTMLTFDLMMAKLHLQEANRNLAWIAGDRFFEDSTKEEFKSRFYASICKYFTDRNSLEMQIKDNEVPMWSFGSQQDFWGIGILEKQTNKGTFNGSTNWGILVAGNMQLTMSRVSGAYVGPLGVSSVLYPNKQQTSSNADDSSQEKSEQEENVKKNAVDLYNASYDLTRTPVPASDEAITGSDFMPESYLFRRNGDNLQRDSEEQYLKRIFHIVTESWPSFTSVTAESTTDMSLSTDRYSRKTYQFAQ